MIKRELQQLLVKMVRKMPALALTGPRQSGKTTLLKNAFPGYEYVNMEHPPTRQQVLNDTDSFLKRHKKGLIIDEIQRIPELFSFLQVEIDKSNKMGKYILSGSQNFLLMENISQSLAGRISLFNLLPYSYTEMKSGKIKTGHVNELIVNGFYPAKYTRKLTPEIYYSTYISTYVERDVRQLINVKDLAQFQKFIQLLAGRTGQLINLSEIGNALGIDQKTVKNWISVLETSYIIFRLQPWYSNINKRIVKTPKIYFYDTGLVCFLLGIENKNQLVTHWAKGALFENLVIADLIKIRMNAGKRPRFYFWRDKNGNEIDLVMQEQGKIKIVEIKSSATFNSSFFKGLNYFSKHLDIDKKQKFIVYDGEMEQQTKEGKILNWKNLNKI